MKRLSLILGIAIAGTASALAGPDVHTGWLTDSLSYGAVRYRAFEAPPSGGNEHYLGIDGLGVPANRVEQGVTWALGTHRVTFTYNPAGTGSLTSRIDLLSDGIGIQTLTFNDFNTRVNTLPGRNLGGTPLNYFQISVGERTPGLNVELEDAQLDSFGLGSFGDDATSSGSLDYSDWYVDNFDFANGFTFTATLRLSGTLAPQTAGDEVNVVNLVFGNSPSATTFVPIPAPGAALLGVLGLSIAGWAKRRMD